MTEKEIQEHLRKELLKKIVDNGQNYTEKMKSDLKEIIDLGKSCLFCYVQMAVKGGENAWQPILPAATDIETVR